MKQRSYAWFVFALTFGLLISDFMARQVLNAVFPLLKTEWLLSDTQLGALSGIVAMMVGILTFPLSLLADRWGRVRSLVLMAALWSIATLACGAAQNYGEMFLGRLFVGLGEAAYGSVGIAVVLTVFPVRMRATLTAAFMAGGLIGQVLGVGLGGRIASVFGWRWAFIAIALAGLCIAVAYPFVVNETRMKAAGAPLDAPPTGNGMNGIPDLRGLFASRAVLCAYAGSGLQLYVIGAISAWLPTFFVRYFGLAVDRAAALAALFLLIGGGGMIACGIFSDRVAARKPERKIELAIGLCLASGLLLTIAFELRAGVAQLVFLGGAMFLASGTTGPAGAMVANLTPRSIHGTAFATLALANNLLGLAPGPIITGRLADTVGLMGAFRALPVACLLSTLAFLLARTSYLADLSRVMKPIAQEAVA